MSTEEGPRPKIYFGLLSFDHKLLELSMRLFFTIIILMMLKTTFNFIKREPIFAIVRQSQVPLVRFFFFFFACCYDTVWYLFVAHFVDSAA